jgi:hypothetical protein
VLLVVVMDTLLIVTVVGELALIARRYRRGRTSGLDVWAALEDGLAVVMPRWLAKVVILEPRLLSCLIRWAFRRTRLGENDFSYHKRSPMGLVLVMVALVTPVEVLFWELLIPWAWLRWLLLILGVYAMFWILAFYASLATLPYRLEDDGLRLRYGAFAEGFVSYAEIAGVECAPAGPRMQATVSGRILQMTRSSSPSTGRRISRCASTRHAL